MNFFVATLGRSGTNWLVSLLDKSPVYTVGHEGRDGRDPRYIHHYTPFPVERFARPNYGEVHGFLRYSLSAGFQGCETFIERRAMMERCPFAVIRSWMQCGKRDDWEFSAVVFEVLLQQRLLREWADGDPEVRQVSFEKMTSDIDYLRNFCSWLDINYEPTEDDMRTKKGESNGNFQWTDELVERVQVIGERQGIERLSPYDITGTL